MATSRRPSETPKTSTPNATRQMLDELDALMERMLALPVNDLSEPAAAPPLEMIEAPALTAQLSLVAPADLVEDDAAPEPAVAKEPSKILVGRLTPSYTAEVEGAAEAPPSRTYTFSSAAPVKSGVASGSSTSPRDWDEAAPVPSPAEILPPLEALASPVSPRPTAVKRYPHRRSLSQWLMQPLVWINRRFDDATEWLGGLGSWLRGSGGRMLLGYAGLALFALAIAWMLRDWLRWGW